MRSAVSRAYTGAVDVTSVDGPFLFGLHHAKAALMPTKKKTAKKRKVSAKQRPKPSLKSLANLTMWKPGQSGNPKGAQKPTCQLYRWICEFMDMTDVDLKKLDVSKLVMAKRVALRIVARMEAGDWPQALEIINRNEGKVQDRVQIDGGLKLNNAEAANVLKALLKGG